MKVEMSLRMLLTLTLVSGLLGGLVVAVLRPGRAAAGPTLAGGHVLAPTGPRSPSSALGSGFTYQGYLLVSGSPATGSYDLQFSLYDALTGPAQVGSTITVLSQTVTAGLFTVSLDFGAAAFAGQARWLEIA